MFQVHRVVAMSVVLLITASTLANVVTYEGLGAANTWGPSGNWFGNLSGTTNTVAQKFTATVSGTFAELYAAIKPDTYTSNRSYTLRLLADASDSPGAVLWETSAQTWPVPAGSIFHLNDLNGPSLVAGQSYWLQADEPVLNSCHSWMTNNQGYGGSFAISTNGVAWEVFDDDVVRGLRVLVAVPEPASVVLLVLGSLALVRRRRTA
jgi:hypothetical protein